LLRESQKGQSWKSIDEYIHSSADNEETNTKRNYLRLLAWNSIKGKLVEALCLLSTLSRHEAKAPGLSISIFRRLGPIPLKAAGSAVFLWTRPSVVIETTGLKACPDLAITSDENRPGISNILSIIECKCRTRLGSNDLRAEFGKAYELKSPSYTIVSYYQPSGKMMRAAEAMGLDMEVFPLASPNRQDYISRRLCIEDSLATALDESFHRRSFLSNIEIASSEMRKKLAIK
jgi:hypothetical protein